MKGVGPEDQRGPRLAPSSSQGRGEHPHCRALPSVLNPPAPSSAPSSVQWAGGGSLGKGQGQQLPPPPTSEIGGPSGSGEQSFHPVS